MGKRDSIVFVVDDDVSFRRSTERLIRLAGFEVRAFSSGSEFLSAKRLDRPSCLVLDVRMSGLSGLDVQRELTKAGIVMPIIFVTGRGDIPMSVQAIKTGAVEFLTKPFREKKLLDAIKQALQSDRAARRDQAKLTSLRAHYDSLTPREREVMAYVVAGLLNKQIATKLHIVEKTIKFHRGHIMQKMQARSLAELVRMAADLRMAELHT